MKKYSYYISIEGLNFDRLFSNLNKQNIKIYDYKRPNYKSCQFGLGFFDYLKIKKQNLLKNYKVEIKKCYNTAFLLKNLLKNMGLYIGGAISIFLILLVGQITLKINVLGLEKIKEEEIVTLLNKINVKTGQINHVSNETIEQYLKENNDKISLVSVVKKGTNIIINIKEKEFQDVVAEPIYSPYNMVINSISVSQGEAKVKDGDVVKKGDVLVSPKQIITSGQTTLLPTIAKINGTAWITGVVQFKTEEVVYERTGNKIVQSYFELNGKKFFSTGREVKFVNYDKVVYNKYIFNNFFLPIKLHKTIYYETKPKTIKRNFEQQQDKLIKQSKDIAYSKLPSGQKVINEQTTISTNGNTITIVTYLQIDVLIEG